MDDLERRIANRIHDAPLPTEYLLDEALDRLRTYREALEQAAEWFEEYGVEHERKASAVKFSNPKKASARRGKALRNMGRALILRQALKG